MAVKIPLEAVANQSLTITMYGSRYDISVKEAELVMELTISRDGELLISGARAVAGTPIIPYRYIDSGYFMFNTELGELPWWESFGSTQSLVYLSSAELS
jgi:hypothetical protein